MSKRSRPERARLEDVARLAQVSKSTASKILNNSPELSARTETKDLVFAAAGTLGYHPHAAARALAGAPARALALLVPELTSPIYSQMVRGAFAQAQIRGYTVLVAEDYEDQRVNERVSTLVSAGRVDIGAFRTYPEVRTSSPYGSLVPAHLTRYTLELYSSLCQHIRISINPLE